MRFSGALLTPPSCWLLSELNLRDLVMLVMLRILCWSGCVDSGWPRCVWCAVVACKGSAVVQAWCWVQGTSRWARIDPVDWSSGTGCDGFRTRNTANKGQLLAFIRLSVPHHHYSLSRLAPRTCLLNTTVCSTPLSTQHHCLLNTTVYSTPLSAQHHCLLNITVYS